MKNLAALVSVSLAALGLVVGCSSSGGDGVPDEETAPEAAPAKADSPTNTAKSDQPSTPVTDPSVSPDGGAASPEGGPAVTPTPADPQACAALTACCAKLNAQYGALACNLIQQKANFDCAKATTACEAAAGLGNGGGGGGGLPFTLCKDDAACPAGKTCQNFICL